VKGILESKQRDYETKWLRIDENEEEDEGEEDVDESASDVLIGKGKKERQRI